MANQSNLSELISAIQTDVKTIVAGEIELAKIEMAPQMKRAGLGAGLFGAAGYLALTALSLLFFAASFAASALFWNYVSAPWTWVLGFVTVAVISLALAGVFALIGKAQVNIDGPRRAIELGHESLDAIKTAVASGQAEVQKQKQG
jgi:hypothetical protein